jgi:thiamine-phosphate pyrophosphorylase
VKPPLPRLVLITDFARGEGPLFATLERAFFAPAGLAVQHRQPGATTRAYWDTSVRLKARCDSAGVPLFVSGRLDVALALGCHLHLPAAALAPADVRPALGPSRLLSCAVHDAAEAGRAAGADFALVSPVWPAGSKAHDARAPLLPEGFRALAAALPCPAFALGGVTPERLAMLGPAGAAAISWVHSASDPVQAVQQLLGALP